MGVCPGVGHPSYSRASGIRRKPKISGLPEAAEQREPLLSCEVRLQHFCLLSDTRCMVVFGCAVRNEMVCLQLFFSWSHDPSPGVSSEPVWEEVAVDRGQSHPSEAQLRSDSVHDHTRQPLPHIRDHGVPLLTQRDRLKPLQEIILSPLGRLKKPSNSVVF